MKNKPLTLFLISALAIAALLLAAGCAGKGEAVAEKKQAADAKPFYSCSADSDCICDGVDEEKQTCYIGNRDYYEAYVNKERKCPAEDFCKGPRGDLVIRCIANHCMQFPQCSFDAECGGGRCVDNRCVSA